MRGGIDLFTKATKVDLAAFGGEFATFSKSAKRLELLPRYNVSNELDIVRAFEAGENVDQAFNADWHDIIRAAAARNANIQRVRGVPRAISSYLKFEISCAYPINSQLGEEIRFAFLDEVEADAGADAGIPDFWVFDDQRAYIMQYDFRGGFFGVLRADDGDSAELSAFVSKLFDRSRPIDWALTQYAQLHH